MSAGDVGMLVFGGTPTADVALFFRGSSTLRLRGNQGRISACVMEDGKGNFLLAFASRGATRCKLQTHGTPALWIGATSFDLLPSEVDPVRSFLSAHGART